MKTKCVFIILIIRWKKQNLTVIVTIKQKLHTDFILELIVTESVNN